MSKLFIIEPQEAAQVDVIAKGVELARQLALAPEVFAYCYEYIPDNPVLFGDAPQQIVKHKRQELTAQLAAHELADVPVNVVWHKHMCEHVAEHSAANGFSMVVKGIYASNNLCPSDWHLLRSSKVPVMLLTEQPLQRGNTVLMALDLDTLKPEKLALNQKVSQYAAQLAEISGATLHLAFIVRAPRLLRDLAVINSHELVKEAYQRHQEALNDIGLPPEQVHFICGDPAQCIYQLSCSLKSQYVVLGANQRQGIAGFVLGNTAEQILQNIRSDVLVIPKGAVDAC
ncbi:universal stress protein [Shewanella sp. C32]|uniref:Universal stress protein n=1 Tax=Shewanella electrica TaxID=515560 RepID=A0ABT2FQG3_9GAMM|nr:universal stress protein [Shewanella electrica]MCH1926939.1 universal stress protein [Shewanella electrica]MCS4558560.1 universal stress protein [Shewanella electrica]